MHKTSVSHSVAIQTVIFEIRGQKVLLDSTLADLYGVKTKALLQAVRRNNARFPGDFMFQLQPVELASLRSQDETLKKGRGKHRKYLPFAFTEQGVAMLSSVLRSPEAISVNIEIMRAFVRMRELVSTHRDLAERIDDLEKKYDERFAAVFRAIRQLMEPPERPRRRIGY
jgi:hypothetical protein